MEKELIQAVLSARVYEVGSCSPAKAVKLKLVQHPGSDTEIHIEGKAYIFDDEQLAAAINFLQAIRINNAMETAALHRKITRLEHELAIAQRRNVAAEEKAEQLF